MSDAIELFSEQLRQIEQEGLTRRERVITSAQGARIVTREAGAVLNFCANDYLGLANHPEVVAAASAALRSHGLGMASVRFICGTQDLHRALEQEIAAFLGKEDAILYTSCFDANTGLFETLLGPQDAVISDDLNHASIIDGIRLCKAARHRYAHGDMEQLEQALRQARAQRLRLIATDGVFSMDGDLARLDAIVELARRYDALVMVDDSHATGVMGPGGRGSAEHYGLLDRVDIVTSTLGKALGGGSGGITAARRPVIELLRQRSRPYLFSNTLAPCLAAAGRQALEIVVREPQRRARLHENAAWLRARLQAAGFELKPGATPILPVMLRDAALARRMAAELLDAGIYVIAFAYPVVPRGEARIRVQVSAAHTREHLQHASDAFAAVGRRLGVIE